MHSYFQMETAFPLQLPHSLRRKSLYGPSFSTPIVVNVRHLLLPENVREPMRDLIRKHITTSTTHPFRFNQTELFCAGISLKDAMADEANKKNSSLVESTIKSEELKKTECEKLTPRNIPPPPEKPLPGDCCGSGCVRCVWDVYYEELEEYNKLYKSSPDSNKPS